MVSRDDGHVADPDAGRALRRSEDLRLVADLSYTRHLSQHDLWPAEHARLGVLFVLSLVALRRVDVPSLCHEAKRPVRRSIPAAILLPLALFLPAFSRKTTGPNDMIYFAYLGTVSLAVGLLMLGGSLIRGSWRSDKRCRRGLA